MFLSKTLAAAALAGAASAQLLVGPASSSFRNTNTAKHANGALADGIASLDADQQQQPLGGAPHKLDDALPSYKAGQHTLTPQDGSACPSYNESQWTGTIDVSDDRRLFFWFFDSRNDPEHDPVIIWLNGGPGGSSLLGMLTEMGPCFFLAGADEPEPNPWAWNNNASLLFIDQPAGVGFSSFRDGSPMPSADMDGAADFQAFLNIFFADVFPSRAGLPIHFAAESYGGHYAPTYTKHILDSRRFRSPDAFWGNITSLVLVDALIDMTSTFVGQYELLCTNFREPADFDEPPVLNRTVCDAIRLAMPECERLGRVCDQSYDGKACFSVFEYCEEAIGDYYERLVESGERNPYNIHLPCDAPPGGLCLDPRKGDPEQYFNRPAVKASLKYPSSFKYAAINFVLNEAYVNTGDFTKPMEREVAAVLDAYLEPAPGGDSGNGDSLGDIKILVLQGNDDTACNTPGNIWIWDKLLWSGHADFRMAHHRELEADADALGDDVTGFWKATPDGRLAFVALDGAGHMVPGDKREGSYRVLERWVHGGWRM